MPNPNYKKYQGDLFIADASMIRTKELQPLMATNWFSLSKDPRSEPIVHEYDRYMVRIENWTGRGIATIWDHDLLIFLISQLVHSHNRGEETGPAIAFTGYEFFQFHQRKWRRGITGKRSYDLLWAALERLHTTHIRTTVKPLNDPEYLRKKPTAQQVADRKQQIVSLDRRRAQKKLENIDEAEAQFYWLPHIEKLKWRDENEVGYVVHLDPTVYEWTKNLSNVLTLSPAYFDLTSGIARFIYLWARKSVGDRSPNQDWTESFDSLYEKSGSTGNKRQFRQYLRRLIKQNNLPSYHLSEEIHPQGPKLVARTRTFEELPELKF